MEKITFANIEWNGWNGFSFTIFGIEYQGRKHYFDGELLGIHFSKDYLIFEIAFIQFNFNKSW